MSALMDEFKKDEAPPQSTNKMMSRGKEINRDFPSRGDRKGKSPN